MKNPHIPQPLRDQMARAVSVLRRHVRAVPGNAMVDCYPTRLALDIVRNAASSAEDFGVEMSIRQCIETRVGYGWITCRRPFAVASEAAEAWGGRMAA